MSQGQHSQVDGDERYSTLLNNSNAVRAVTSAVEGTLGPKGLDVMLAGPRGEVVITNDGVTILDKMDVTHPAARLLIQVARAQQEKIGDGTTTATVLAGALVQEGVSRITRGVPASKVVEGLRQGVEKSMQLLSKRVRLIGGLDDPLLERTVHVAGRERKDIVELVMQAARKAGIGRLQDPSYSLADSIIALENAENEVFEGFCSGSGRSSPGSPSPTTMPECWCCMIPWSPTTSTKRRLQPKPDSRSIWICEKCSRRIWTDCPNYP